ncbi:MAG: Spo0B domain-containing protein [Bacilli bacterium]
MNKKQLKMWYLILGLIILFLYLSNDFFIKLILTVVAVSIITYLMFNDDKETKKAQETQSNVVDVIGHFRHDSMNHLQVIYGYVTMKKFEQIVPFIQKVTDTYHQYSRISQLGPQPFNEYLITYNAVQTKMKVDIQLSEYFPIPLPLPVQSSFQEMIKNMIHYYEYFNQNDGTANVLNIEMDRAENTLSIGVTFTSEQDHAHSGEPFSLEEVIIKCGGTVSHRSPDLPPTEWDIHIPLVDQ